MHISAMRFGCGFRPGLLRRPILKRPIQPDVSIIIAARNEEENLPAKLENLRLLDYPKDRLQIVIASDGSNGSDSQYFA